MLTFAAWPICSCSDDDDRTTEQQDDDDDDNDIDDNDSDDDTDTGTADDVELDDEEDDIANNKFSSQITITFSGASATVEGSADSVTVSTSGAHVTVDSRTKGVAYTVKGSTNAGSLKIYSEKKYKLVLSDADITSDDGPAIDLQSAKRAFVVLEGSSRLADSPVYSETGEDRKATLFAEGKILVSGSGSLSVCARHKHAICSDDYIRFYDGRITVTEAATDAIHANDAVVVSGGRLDLAAADDAIDCSGFVIVDGGEIVVDVTSDGSKGIKTDSHFTMSGGTVSIGTSGNSFYADADMTYCTGIKSDGSISISGGTLTISATGIAGRGIGTDADLSVTGGSVSISTAGNGFKVTATDAATAKCINCDGNATITGGTVSLTATGTGGKGLVVDGELTIGGDAELTATTTGARLTLSNNEHSNPKAVKSTGNLTVDGGHISLSTNHEGGEGLESKNTVTINGGTIEATTYDDAINAAKAIVINGGFVCAYASNNDGIDSNGTLTVSGGVVVASGTSSPEEGFDCDQNTFKITGGLLVGTGGATSTPTANACTQRSVVYGGASATAGKYLCISRTQDGEQLLVYRLPRTLSQMTLLFSSPDIAAGTAYTINVGGTVSGGTEYFGGIIRDAQYTAGSTSAGFTPSGMVSTIGNTGGPGGPGGGGRP